MCQVKDIKVKLNSEIYRFTESKETCKFVHYKLVETKVFFSEPFYEKFCACAGYISLFEAQAGQRIMKLHRPADSVIALFRTQNCRILTKFGFLARITSQISPVYQYQSPTFLGFS